MERRGRDDDAAAQLIFGLATVSDGRVAQTGSQQPPSSTAEVYDPATDTWTTVASMPTTVTRLRRNFAFTFSFKFTPLLMVERSPWGGSGWNFTPFLASVARPVYYVCGGELASGR